MKNIDKIAIGGFTASFGVYYTNIASSFISNLNLNPTIYNLTVGGMPELFTGLLGVRLANGAANLFSKMVENKDVEVLRREVLPKKLDSILENVDKNKTLYSTLAAGGAILGFGIIDESVYNLSGGTQDLNDILMYGLGVGIASYYNYLHKK